jgi:ABC-type multidrug transport system fused ATPase/permease subunit
VIDHREAKVGVTSMSKDTKNDFTIIYRYLLPELRPYLWLILRSFGMTGIVVGADLIQPYCFKWLLDAATVFFNYRTILLMLFMLFGLAIIRSFLGYWEIYARSKVGEAVSAQYRAKTFEHILHLPFATLHTIKSGVLEHRVMDDCGMIGRVYVSTQLLPMIANLVQVLALVVLILILSWNVGLASILVFPLGFLISQQMTKRSHARLHSLRTLVERGQGELQEVISCIKEIRATGNEEGEIQRWKRWLHEYGQVTSITTTENQFIRVTLNRLVDWIGLTIVFGYGGWQLLHHTLTIGTLLALALYVQQLYSILATILSSRIETGEVANALQSITAILDLPREWPDQGIHDLGEVQGRLEFADVSFSYNGCAENVQHISLKSIPGEVIGIVGPSGSGKSTLINLCMRFYTTNEGKILLDGVDIADIAPHTLRQQIGIVSQDVQLWNATIRENLLYGLQREIPWDDVVQLCEKTHVHAFVQHLPEGYETAVGSRGVKLSGGEKQRIALTRMLLRDPKILLLDEATSALDSLTESAITNTLLQAFEKKNRILVAHRLATVQSADQIIVIKDGQIIEQGSPKTLYQQNGLYKILYDTQKLGTEELSITSERQ